MAKNRLFGWMFVEDSNKESETIKPCTSQEASAVPSPVVTSVPAPTIMASGGGCISLKSNLHFSS